jgi:hypothetical protein
MKYRKLDENDDYTFGFCVNQAKSHGRRDEFYYDTEAVAQAVKTRLLLLYGEWWEDTSDGTPLFEEVLGHRFRSDGRPAMVDLVFSERITATQGVSEITFFDSGINPNTRGYWADITIKTIYDTEFQLTLSAGSGILDIIIH